MRWIAVLALVGCPKTVEVPPAVTDPELAKPLPVDADVKTGTFANGMRWYVQQNAEPDDRAVLRLAVDVGSVLEDDDQLGVAHFVEHMAFNGTTHFPGNALVNYLESVGTQFGPHLNAHTSFDETVYKLTVPTDDAEVFEKAFLVLEDWASGLSFDAAEIEKERPVVLEEWRTRLGAQGRIQEQTVPLTFFGSPYAVRLPIGTEESLHTISGDAIRRFYTDWYRPDRMAVIAVGDFDEQDVIAKIAAHFEGLPKPTAPRERVKFEVPDHDDTKYAIVADPELTRSAVTVIAKLDRVEGTTHADYRDDLLERLAFEMINERLAELARSPAAPFLGAGAGVQRLTPEEAAFALSAGTKEDGTVAGYEALLVEVRRVREHGFGAAELERARARVLKGYESLLLEQDKLDSTTEANEIVRVFTTGEPMPGTAYEVELARKYVPQITLAEVVAWSSQWMGERSRVVSVILPARAGLAVPTTADLAAVGARVAAMTIDPLPEEAAAGELVADLPPPGTITATDEQFVASLGFTGWTLSNGVRVWWKDTDFKADEVLFRAFSPGGESLVPDADVVSARLMLETMHRSGFGGLDANGYARWLAGRAVGIDHGLFETWETVAGEASPSDLSALLETVWAATAEPRFSEEGFQTTLAQHTAGLQNRMADPNTQFNDAYVKLVWKDDPRLQPWTVETLSAANLERIRSLYTDRFGDLGDATFVFVGNLPDDFRPLVEAYLATLPAKGRTETFVDRGRRATPGKLETVVRSGLDPQARVRLEWRGDLPDNTWETRSRLFGLGDVLDTLLREQLREELGGVYGVGVSAGEEYRPIDRYTVRVEFGCDPTRVDELVAATEAVVKKLRTEGPPAATVEQEKEKNRRSRQENLRTNGFWLSAFSGALQRETDPLQILTWDQRNEALNAAVIQTAAKTWLDDSQRVKVVLLPADVAKP